MTMHFFWIVNHCISILFFNFAFCVERSYCYYFIDLDISIIVCAISYLVLKQSRFRHNSSIYMQ